jgi:Tfp pilus assembly protein PilF
MRLAGLALVLAACVSPVEEARQKDSAETQVALAQAYLQQNDVRQAMPPALKAVELDPNNMAAYLTLGRIHHMEGRWDQALEAYQKALALDPKRGDTYYLIGVVRYQMKDAPGAVEFLRKALAQPAYLSPQDAHLYLGGILLDQGKVDEALVEFRKAVDVEPEFGLAYNAMGFALLQKQRPDEAIESLTRAVRFSPTLVAAYQNLGRAYLLVGKKDEARVNFKKVVEMAPANAPMAAEARKALADLGGEAAAPAPGAPPAGPSPPTAR